MEEMRFGSEFPAFSFDDWVAAATKTLGGGDFSALRTELYEGFATEPLYRPDAIADVAGQSGTVGASPFIRGKVPAEPLRPWTIIQLLDHLDLDEANRQLREDIANGAGAVWIQFGGNLPYGGAFLGARRVAALEKVFDGVALGDLEFYISGGTDTAAGAALVAAFIEKRGVLPGRIRGAAGFDPLTVAAARGLVPAERPRLYADAVDAATYFRDKGYRWRPFLVSSRAWHQSGGSAREELGFSLAAGVAYWRALIEAGWTLEEAADAVAFVLTADSDLFLTIAKFRAMRALWARVTDAAGLPPRMPSLIGEMSFRMIAERDPYVNMLRATAAAFGAGLGGAEALLLIPFNTRHGTPDAFARRMTRNTHLILQQEAQLGRVADAAGGSAYVEALTHQLAGIAWNEFRQIEAQGGMLAALLSGTIGRKLMDCAIRRHAGVAFGRDKITGVSSFPDLQEEPLFSRPEDLAIDLTALDEEGRLPQLPRAEKGKRFAAMVEAAAAGATLKGLERACETLMERFDLIPASMQRAAEPFEQLRTASDRALARIHTRPPVFLANLGALADYTGRSSWAKSFFAAGGIEAVDEGGFTNRVELVRSFQRSPAPVACICASDKMLSEMPGVAVALKEGGAAAVYLAADPSVLAALPEESKRGIDRVIYAGCNMLRTLVELHELMRVKELGDSDPDEMDEDLDDDAPAFHGR
jgi:methylmalonyl-CoA mutase